MALALPVDPHAQEAGSAREAEPVLAAMRLALGGDTLDAARTFSVSGRRSLTSPFGRRSLSMDWYVILPDHFLEVRRDTPSGPVQIEITYYSGFRGGDLIRHTDSRGVQFPPEPFSDMSPAAVAARRAAGFQHAKQAFARLHLALFGSAPADYPLRLTHGGTVLADGRTFDVIVASGPDGFECRLHIDASTRLPDALVWRTHRPMVVSTSSTMTMRGGEVVSQGTPSNPSLVSGGTPDLVERRWTFSRFRTQDGITWPRRILETGDDGWNEEITFGNVRINPKIDRRRFEVR